MFDDIWVQPAAGDAGGVLGAALAVWHQHLGNPRATEANTHDAMAGSYLGPGFEQTDIERRVAALGGHFTVLSEKDLIAQTAQALADGKTVGWFQGRMEFGPRALGARSILGDPRSPTMQKALNLKVLNLKVKYRESFRPFAPSVLREDVAEWFQMNRDSPYILMVAPVIEHRCHAMNEAERNLFGIDKLNVPRSEIPAVTHVDYSARIQTVHADTNPAYHALISRFKQITGCRFWSTPVSTCAVNQSCAHPKMLSDASWGLSSIRSPSDDACLARQSKIQPCRRITRTPSSWTDSATAYEYDKVKLGSLALPGRHADGYWHRGPHSSSKSGG